MTALRRILLAVAVFLVAVFPVGGASIAGAAEEATTPDKALQGAKEAFEAAQTLFVKEQFDPAAAKFLEAFDQKPYPAFLFNAAVSYEKAKHLDMAQQYFERYLEKDPGASDAAQVKARIETLKAMQGPPPQPPPAPGAPAAPGAPPAEGAPPAPGAAPEVPGGPPATPPAAPGNFVVPLLTLPAIETKGLVVIDSKPQGATIYLNDKKSGPFAKTPWQGSLESKPVRLLLEAKGFKPEQRALSPRSDKLVDVYIALSEEHFLGWVEIASNATGAQVFIDRKDIGAIGRTPFTGHLKPGKHTIYLERMGYKPTEKLIDILPGTATQYTMPMEKGDNGWISVVGRGTFGGRLLVDDKFACATPCRHEVSPGPHEIEVEKQGMEDYELEVNVDKTVETIIDVQFSPRPSRKRAWISAGLAAAILGGGLYVGHLSNNTKDEINRDYKNGLLVNSNDSRFQKAKLQMIGADVLYGLGALIAISSVFSFFAHGPDSVGVIDQKAVGFAPEPMSDGAGLSAFREILMFREVLLLVAGVFAVGSAACDWREVDKLAERAPVLSVGAPSGFGPEDDFGRVLVPIAAPSDNMGVIAARFVVSGTSATGLALVEINGRGQAKSRNLKSPILDGLDGYPLRALAEIPGPKPGRVLVAAPELKNVGGGEVFIASLGAMATIERFAMVSEAGFGIGLAAGSFAGAGVAATPDYVVLSADQMRVYVDGSATAAPLTYLPANATDACPIGLSFATAPAKFPLNRPVLAGHWVDAAAAGTVDQVAVGTPTETGKGSVSLFAVAGAITCLQTITGTEAKFGQSVASGDFNGDAIPDLLVGAPPLNAYIFFGPIGPSPMAVSLPSDAAGAVRFGAAVAAVNVDGMGGDDALVGDPDATVKGAALAGAVERFSLSGTTPTRLMNEIADFDPGAGASFGTTVTALRFCPEMTCAATAPRLAVVGSGTEVFTHFKLSATDVDPRQK